MNARDIRLPCRTILLSSGSITLTENDCEFAICPTVTGRFGLKFVSGVFVRVCVGVCVCEEDGVCSELSKLGDHVGVLLCLPMRCFVLSGTVREEREEG